MVSVGPEAADVTFTGVTSDGTTKYGPETFPLASEHFLTGVHQDVVLMMVEYTHADGSLHATAEVPVQIKMGETATQTALATKALVVQLVNESGLPDENVYVLLRANRGVLTKRAYRAAITSDQAGGFVATCRPTAAMDNSPQGSLGDTNYPNDPNLPKDLTVEVSLSKEFFNQLIIIEYS